MKITTGSNWLRKDPSLRFYTIPWKLFEMSISMALDGCHNVIESRIQQKRSCKREGKQQKKIWVKPTWKTQLAVQILQWESFVFQCKMNGFVLMKIPEEPLSFF